METTYSIYEEEIGYRKCIACKALGKRLFEKFQVRSLLDSTENVEKHFVQPVLRNPHLCVLLKSSSQELSDIVEPYLEDIDPKMRGYLEVITLALKFYGGPLQNDFLNGLNRLLPAWPNLTAHQKQLQENLNSPRRVFDHLVSFYIEYATMALNGGQADFELQGRILLHLTERMLTHGTDDSLEKYATHVRNGMDLHLAVTVFPPIDGVNDEEEHRRALIDRLHIERLEYELSALEGDFVRLKTQISDLNLQLFRGEDTDAQAKSCALERDFMRRLKELEEQVAILEAKSPGSRFWLEASRKITYIRSACAMMGWECESSQYFPR